MASRRIAIIVPKTQPTMVPARERVDAVDTPGCVALAVVLVVLTSGTERHPFCMSKLLRVRGVRVFPP
jgi:hypothetical protein